MSKLEIYVADFETSHATQDGQENAWVWCAGYSRVYSKKINRFGNIRDFINSLTINKSKKVYFHNLKFDGDFILSYCLGLGYTYSQDLNKDKQIHYIIDNSGAVYTITITFMSNKKVRKLTFIDSLKLYPYSLATIAKQFGFDVQKGDMDYDLVRQENHILTDGEISYFNKDIIILRTAMENAIDKGLTKLTIGSNALADYKATLDSTGISKYLFEYAHPKLTIEEDTYIRNAYKGGCCMVKKGMENKITKTNSYDVNSMYPSVLLNKKMPYGKPIYFKGKYMGDMENMVWVQHLKCTFKIKPKHLPTIQLKHTMVFNDNEWVEECGYVVDLYLTNIDLILFFDHYDVDVVEWVDGYYFKAIKGLYSIYINKWYNIKCNTKDKGERAFSKLFLNNLYGKFGTNPRRKSARLGIANGEIFTKEYVEEECEPIYIPTAVFTTAYGRYILITNAQKNYDKFIYCDTDSIHTTEKVDNIDIDNKRIGAFKFEYSGYAKYIKQKCYMVMYDKEYQYKNDNGDLVDRKVVCSGLNQEKLTKDGIVIDFNNFKLGNRFNKLKKVRCSGGCYLKQCEHTIT